MERFDRFVKDNWTMLAEEFIEKNKDAWEEYTFEEYQNWKSDFEPEFEHDEV